MNRAPQDTGLALPRSPGSAPQAPPMFGSPEASPQGRRPQRKRQLPTSLISEVNAMRQPATSLIGEASA